MKKILLDCVDILDFKRIPLSANEREKMKKIYPYYGAQGIIDYVEDFIFDGEYILIAEDGENLRSLNKNIATWATGKFWVNNHAHILGDNGNSNLRFIYYFLSSMDLRKYVTGSAQPKLNQYNLANLEIDLPPLEIQKKIGNFLYSLDEKISLNKKINATLEEMAKTIYDYYFVQFDFPDENGKPYKSSGGKMIFSPELQREIPFGWEVGNLENKISITRGISYSSENISNSNGFPMINLASIDRKRNYIPEGLKFFEGKISDDKKLKAMDMLIACTDLTMKAEIIGSPILVMNDREYIFSMDLAKLTICDKNIENLYLYMTLRTKFYHKYITGFASGTTVLHLDTNGINLYKILIPPKNLQKKFCKVMEKIYLETCKNISENNLLERLRDFLLPMLMNGQVGFKEE